jgi:hypothetical protein
VSLKQCFQAVPRADTICLHVKNQDFSKQICELYGKRTSFQAVPYVKIEWKKYKTNFRSKPRGLDRCPSNLDQTLMPRSPCCPLAMIQPTNTCLCRSPSRPTTPAMRHVRHRCSCQQMCSSVANLQGMLQRNNTVNRQHSEENSPFNQVKKENGNP